jgi:hypothetical protein
MSRIQNSQSCLVALASAVLIAYAVPALAMTGSEAVRACEKKEGCTWHVNDDDSIVIVVEGYDIPIYCADITSECGTVLRGTKKRIFVNPQVFSSGSDNQGNNGTGQGPPKSDNGGGGNCGGKC